MEKAAKAAAGVLSILDIGVLVFVWYTSLSRSQDNIKQLELKVKIDKVYMLHSKARESQSFHLNDNTEIMASPSLEFLSLLKPVSHFSGFSFEKVLKVHKTGQVSVRNWANPEGSERTLLYNDMTYQNGSITVPVAGIYHIKSHVKFYVEGNRKGDNSSQTFHHQIVRYSASAGKQVVLFDNVETECREGINEGAHLEYPSLIGGLAQLDAGDQVIVRVSHFLLLRHDKDWHYFDMYLV